MLALVPDSQTELADQDPQMAALHRARLALAEATLASELYPIATHIHAARQAMKALDVSAEVKRQADDLFVRAMFAFGVALRQEFGALGPKKIAAALGAGLSTVRAATAMGRVDGKPLEAYLAYFEDRHIGLGINTLWKASVALHRVGPPVRHERKTPKPVQAEQFVRPIRCPHCRKMFMPE